MQRSIASRRNTAPVRAAFALTAFLAACAADSEPESDPTTNEPAASVEVESSETIAARDKALNLVAKIERDEASLKFYEPEPGTLIEVETGPMRATRAFDGDDLSFVQRYQRIAGASAPRALVDAQQRVERSRGIRVPAATPSEYEVINAQPDTAAASNKEAGLAFSESWFHGTYCVKTDRYWPDSSVSASEGKRLTGDSSFSATGLNYMKAGAFAYRGGVLYRYSYSCIGCAWQDWSVQAGHYVGFRSESSVNRTGSSRVWNADGDGYSHCVNYHY